MSSIDLPIRAATETALAHGVIVDRCDILQNASTLVLRLSETLVARIVIDVAGPRQGAQWFARENAIAQHLTQQEAPVIPLHPDLPAVPHERHGYTMSFWKFVTAVSTPVDAIEAGAAMRQCHRAMASFPEALPSLAIVTESLDLLATLSERRLMDEANIDLLRHHLEQGIESMKAHPAQALHGDAHLGNLMNTTSGLLWTDWEDTFSGPVEWDVASAVWNDLLLEGDLETTAKFLEGYRSDGTTLDAAVFEQCLAARAAVISAWYPILYPAPDESRRLKLSQRLQWLQAVRAGAAVLPERARGRLFAS